MLMKRTPAVLGAPRGPVLLVNAAKLDGPDNKPNYTSQQAPSAELIGAEICRALGHSVQSPTPVLALCRKLVAAGIDPATPLHVYRGATLCLIVRSIGEGAALEVHPRGRCFVSYRAGRAAARRAASPVRFARGVAK
jgi:hypothetical protein